MLSTVFSCLGKARDLMGSCPVTQGAQPAMFSDNLEGWDGVGGGQQVMFSDNLEGWDGVGGGQQVQEEGGIYIYIYTYG